MKSANQISVGSDGHVEFGLTPKLQIVEVHQKYIQKCIIYPNNFGDVDTEHENWLQVTVTDCPLIKMIHLETSKFHPFFRTNERY